MLYWAMMRPRRGGRGTSPRSHRKEWPLAVHIWPKGPRGCLVYPTLCAFLEPTQRCACAGLCDSVRVEVTGLHPGPEQSEWGPMDLGRPRQEPGRRKRGRFSATAGLPWEPFPGKLGEPGPE